MSGPMASEHQDQSIKARKFQLFEGSSPDDDGDGDALKPFSYYVGRAPAAPLTPVVKVSLWATGVLVLLLFLAAMFLPKSRKRQAALTPERPAAVARHAGESPPWPWA
ncbi:MAG: hypothetical protein LC745_00580 [Planctomycetia bacterium]|nr:hypothetical protein [Planctomycetia bacterium]